MSVLDNDPAILALKSRCTALETNGNMLEERIKGLQTALNEEIPPPVIQEFRDVSQAVAAESSKIRELAGRARSPCTWQLQTGRRNRHAI